MLVVKEPIQDSYIRRLLYALSILAKQAHRIHSYYGAFAFHKGPSVRSQFLLRSIVALLLGTQKTQKPHEPQDLFFDTRNSNHTKSDITVILSLANGSTV